MNYRHAFHAGNFADVAKHLAEVAILEHLAKKESPFAVIDSHAGRGRYDLASEEARKTGEAGAGIEKLRGLSGPAAAGPLSWPGREHRSGQLSRLAPDRGADVASAGSPGRGRKTSRGSRRC